MDKVRVRRPRGTVASTFVTIVIVGTLGGGCGSPPEYLRIPALVGSGGGAASSGRGTDGGGETPGTGGVTPAGSTGGAGTTVASGGGGGSGGTTAGTGGAGGTTSSTGGRAAAGSSGGNGGAGATAGAGGRVTLGTGGGVAAGTGAAGTGGTIMTGHGVSDFESSSQSWAARVRPGLSDFASVTFSTTQHFSGQASLAGTIESLTGGLYQLAVKPMPGVAPGATITFHIFFPVGSMIDWVQPFAVGFEMGVPPMAAWTGTGVPTANLKAATWNTMEVAVPASSPAIEFIGVEFHLGGPWSGTVYVDDVTW